MKKGRGWFGEKRRHSLARRGIKSSGVSKSHFKEMEQDERSGARHYREMARLFRRENPQYAEVFEEMARDESRHLRYIQSMERKGGVNVRDVVKDNSLAIINKLEEKDVITPVQKGYMVNVLDRNIKRMPIERLRARGIEASIVGGLLGGMMGGLGEGIGSGLVKGGK